MCPKIRKIYYFTKKFQQNQPKKPKISLKINQKPIFFLKINQKTKKKNRNQLKNQKILSIQQKSPSKSTKNNFKNLSKLTKKLKKNISKTTKNLIILCHRLKFFLAPPLVLIAHFI